MHVELAGRQHLAELASLLWHHASPDEQGEQSLEGFTTDLAAWWVRHEDSHHAFVARVDGQAIGMAWLALLARTPRPGNALRCSADIQSVYVLPQHRGRGVGAQLVNAASEHAFRAQATRVTVQSGRRAVPLYERLGFASSPRLLQLPPD